MSIAILEWVKENESISYCGGMNNRGNTALVHTLVGSDQAFHQVGEIFRLRTREMDFLFLPDDRLADIVLVRPVVGLGKSWIDNAILQVDQFRLLAEIFAFSHLKQRDEALCSGWTGRDVFDLEG